jgi:GrpB-like predicted nucleotidyltransferase (UPF0157 family)
VRDDYYLLKKRLAEREWNSGDEYAAAKSDFINQVLNQALK